jgi:hypothetical protein
MKKARTIIVVTFFVFEEKKIKMTASVTFFDALIAKNGNINYRCLLQWFCCEKGDNNNVIALFYGGGVVNKAMATNGFLLSFFLFLFIWFFGLVH